MEDHLIILRSYILVYQALSTPNQAKYCIIDYYVYRVDFAPGYTFLKPDQGAEQGHIYPIKTSNLRIKLQFGTGLADTINVVVYTEFDNSIEINGLREVITDYLPSGRKTKMYSE